MDESNYRIFKALWLCVLGITIGLLAQRADTLMREVTDGWPALTGNSLLALESLKTALASVRAIELNTTRTEAEMAGLLNQTRHSMMTPAQTKELVDKAAKAMEDADVSIQKLGEAAASLEAIAPSTQGAVQQIAEDTHDTMQATQAMIGAATKDLADTNIQSTMISVRETAQATASATAHLDATAADLQKVADEWSAPVKGFWKRLKLFAFEVAGPLASVASAIK